MLISGILWDNQSHHFLGTACFLSPTDYLTQKPTLSVTMLSCSFTKRVIVSCQKFLPKTDRNFLKISAIHDLVKYLLSCFSSKTPQSKPQSIGTKYFSRILQLKQNGHKKKAAKVVSLHFVHSMSISNKILYTSALCTIYNKKVYPSTLDTLYNKKVVSLHIVHSIL